MDIQFVLRIDESDLDTRFTPYYTSGERVEVTYSWGDRERFYVGKSTGQKPIYIMLKQRKSTGGPAILSSEIVAIRPTGIFREK